MLIISCAELAILIQVELPHEARKEEMLSAMGALYESLEALQRASKQYSVILTDHKYMNTLAFFATMFIVSSFSATLLSSPIPSLCRDSGRYWIVSVN